MYSAMTAEKPRPKQLRPLTLVVALIELGLAVWAFTVMRHHWQLADDTFTGPFWGAAAVAGFAVGLVLTNGIGVLQTLWRLLRHRPAGRQLAVRLSAVEDAHQEIAVGLIPLILAFGLPVYPLVQIVWLNWLEDLQLVWIGLALTGTLVALLCLYAIGRQLYLLLLGGKTVVEVSHEMIHSGQSIQMVLIYRPGRVPAQALEARLVCCQTVQQKMKTKGHSDDRGYKAVMTVLYEKTLATYHKADLPQLVLGSLPVIATIPEEAHFSTEADEYPTIEWRIEVKVKVPLAPDFCLVFPFAVTEKK